MPRQLGIPSALRSFGLTVEVVPGWESRGSSSFTPKGVVDHWTAGPCGSTSRPSLNIVTYGRPDLSGPLCQVYLDRYGVAVVVAAGRANHAGSGGWNGVTGNTNMFGIEAEACRDGDWTDLQRVAYPIVNAALLSLTPNAGNVEYVCGHNEWAPGRKIDIRDWDMPAMRAQVAAVLGGSYTPPAPRPPGTAPAFPLPGGYYFGPRYPLSNARSVSGYYGNREHLRIWQQQMRNRGWRISADGLYGPETARVALAFQSEKGLSRDSLVGPATWAAAWAAPIT